MPLCARCTGIYMGAFFAFCFLFLRKRMQGSKPFSLPQAVLTGFAILPIGVDGVGSYLGFWESSQILRILTGSLVGAVVPGFLLMAGNFDPKKENEAPIYEGTKELLLLMAVSVGFGLCIGAGLPLQGGGTVFSITGEVLLWGGFLWLVLKNILPQLAFWKLALPLAFGGLFIIGGLVL